MEIYPPNNSIGFEMGIDVEQSTGSRRSWAASPAWRGDGEKLFIQASFGFHSAVENYRCPVLPKIQSRGYTMNAARILLCVAAVAWASTTKAQTPSATGMNEHPNTYAQKLVDETLAKHKEVVIMALHVTPPNQTENMIIASNIGRIGKKADEDDMRVINTGTSNLEVNKAGNHFEDEVPLLDANGHRIGAAGIVFNYKAGDDKQKLAKMAEQVRDEMAKQIPSKEKLFEEVK
jgi:hypothetical protein